MSLELQHRLENALQTNRVVIVSVPIERNPLGAIEGAASNLWQSYQVREVGKTAPVDREVEGMIVLNVEMLIGTNDRTSFLRLLGKGRPTVLVCDCDWLEDFYVCIVRPAKLDCGVITTSESGELPIDQRLSKILPDSPPIGSRAFRDELRKRLFTLGSRVAHPLVLRWLLMDWIDGRYPRSGCSINAVTKDLELTFNLRRALRSWTTDLTRSNLEQATRLFLVALWNDDLRPSVRKDILTPILLSNELGCILDNARSALYAHKRAPLREAINFVRVNHLPHETLVSILQFLQRNIALLDSYDHPWVLDTVRHWSEAVTAETPYPDGCEAVVSLLMEWLGRFNTFNLRERFKECLSLLALIPLKCPEFFNEVYHCRDSHLIAEIARKQPKVREILRRDLPSLLREDNSKPVEAKLPLNDTKDAPTLHFGEVVSRGDELVRWAHQYLRTGETAAKQAWPEVLEQAIEMHVEASDEVAKVGIGLVAAICAKSHWDSASGSQKEWILTRLEDSLLDSFENWEESARTHRFFFSPDRHTASALPKLLTLQILPAHQERVEALLPYALLHPVEEVRRFTALSLGQHRKEIRTSLFHRCFWATIAEDLRREDTTPEAAAREVCRDFERIELPYDAQASLPDSKLRLLLLQQEYSIRITTETETDQLFAQLEAKQRGSLDLDPPPEIFSSGSSSPLADFWQTLSNFYRSRSPVSPVEQSELTQELAKHMLERPGEVKSNPNRVKAILWLLESEPSEETRLQLLEQLDMSHLDYLHLDSAVHRSR